MKTELKEKLRKNPKIECIIRYLAFPILLTQNMHKDMQILHRKYSTNTDIKYKKMQEIKNTHVGERCFIVATGPSLSYEDINQIKNEYCFGMNSDILLFEKTDWRPMFYGIQDEYVYQKLKDEVFDQSKMDLKGRIYVGDNLAKSFDIPKEYGRFPLHYLDHKMAHRNGFGHFKFSEDCQLVVYDGYSIIFSIMQIACYMGFREIYLLGCDCNYQQTKSHFVEYGYKDPHAAIMGNKLINAHAEFKKFADLHNVNVINCTRGGMLEVYPRMRLEEVLKN